MNKLERMTPFKQRAIVSSIGTAIVLTAIYLSTMPIFNLLFILAIIVMIGIALNEFYHIAETKNFKPAKLFAIMSTAAYIIAIHLSLNTTHPILQLLPEFTLLTSFIAGFLYYFGKGSSPFINLSMTFFGLIYLMIPLSCMIRIVYFFEESGAQDGRFWLLYLISVAKMTDMGGYIFGKKFGKHQLVPYISPKKTWEGAIGGIFFAIFTSLIVMGLASILHVPFSITLWQSIWLGGFVGIVAECGDLAESLLKRDGGLKDSSHLPGLGGMLDIVDSLIFAAPLVYLFLKVNF